MIGVRKVIFCHFLTNHVQWNRDEIALLSDKCKNANDKM